MLTRGASWSEPGRWVESVSRSLFIAGLAFADPTHYAAAKIAIFIASLFAGVLGTIILYPRRHEESAPRSAMEAVDETNAVGSAF